MTEIKGTPEKSISERLSEVLAQLTPNQLRFVVAMKECSTKKEAAKAIDLEPNTVYGWPKIVDDAVRLVALSEEEAARAIRKRSLVKAIMVKVSGLDSDDEGTRQKTATEIIEWELGKASQPVTGKDGGPVEHTVKTVTVKLPIDD